MSPLTAPICTLVKPSCTAQTLVPQNQWVVIAPPALTTISLTLEEEFQGMGVPLEFQGLNFTKCVAPPFVGGRVRFFQKNWEIITQDPWVLSVVRHQVPGRVGTDSADKRTSSTTFQQGAEMKAMLEKCAIQQVSDCPGQFISPLFLVDNKRGWGWGVGVVGWGWGGGKRPVINLKRLNHLVQYKHFQMEGLGTLLKSLRQGESLSKLDMKDAYFQFQYIPRIENF